MKKKLVLMTSALMTIGFLAGCNNHVHNWGDVVYEWSADHKSCTATRVCKDDESHKETETKNSVYAVTKEAKCEEDGSGRFTVTFDNEVFGITHFDITLEHTGHDWGTPTYAWSDDYSSCTATRVCKNDSNHIESETSDSVYTVIVPATCDTDGSAVYDAAFENEAFEAQTHDITLPATEHNWGEPTYVWSDDNLKCTATRVCANDESHKETETVDAVITPYEEPDCTNDGYGKYTATFTKEAFEAQNKDAAIARLGHDYHFRAILWADEGYTAAAELVCSRDENHIKYEDATITSEVTTEPGCETEGVRTYMATYDGHTSTKTGPVSATGHSWGTPTYTWAADNSKCTATAVCKTDPSHTLTETVASVYSVVTPATEENEGSGKYTVKFTNSEFATQEREVAIETLPTLSKLTFTSNGDGTYSVKGKDDITGRVKIPSTYGEGEQEGAVTTIPNQAFFAFEEITEAFIPSTIKTIGTDAFYRCEKLTDVHFAENSVLESIGDTAFQRCHSLVSVTLPKSVKTLGRQVFNELNNLESVAFEEGNELESLGRGCFTYCPKLKTIKLAEACKFTEIDHAFTNLGALEELDLPNSIESLTTYCIEECSSLKTLWLPKGLKSMKIYSIYACPIDDLHFKGTVDEWNKVGKVNNWCLNISTNVVHCTDGDVNIK